MLPRVLRTRTNQKKKSKTITIKHLQSSDQSPNKPRQKNHPDSILHIP
jgi:hypothetical protein